MEENKLDGNTAGGVLQQIFPFEMTLVRATCTSCSATDAIGALAAYMHGMGTIIRCPSCDRVLIRVSQTNGHYWLDMQGVRVLQVAIPSEEGVSSKASPETEIP